MSRVFSLRPMAVAAALCAVSLSSSVVWAADASHATIVSGSGSVNTAGNTTTVTQNSAVLRVNWTALDVLAHETLRFNQGSASHVAVNVVTGGSASQILGAVQATGKVYWINPNGLVIGNGAQINVGSFVASALALESFDPVSGRVVLSGGGGSVSNAGSITAATGGTIALIGQQVTNTGTLTVPAGQALLLAGGRVVATPDTQGALQYSVDKAAVATAIQQSGTISALDGSIELNAQSLASAVVNTSGLLEAGAVADGTAGTIRLVAGGAPGSEITVAGTLNAGELIDPIDLDGSPQITAELSEGGKLNWHNASTDQAAPQPPLTATTWDVRTHARDKVYDGTDAATVWLDLRDLPNAGEASLQVDTARFANNRSEVGTDLKVDVSLSGSWRRPLPPNGPRPVTRTLTPNVVEVDPLADITGAPVVPPVVTPPGTTPPTGTPPDIIGPIQQGGNPTNIGVNLSNLSDFLNRLPAPAAGEYEDEELVGTIRLPGDSPLQLKDGGVKLPAQLR